MDENVEHESEGEHVRRLERTVDALARRLDRLEETVSAIEQQIIAINEAEQ